MAQYPDRLRLRISPVGGGADQAAHDALEVLVDAISRGDPRTKQLWFDVTGMGTVPKMTPDELAYFATKIRQLGVQRVVYGSDSARLPPTWRRTALSLTPHP